MKTLQEDRESDVWVALSVMGYQIRQDGEGRNCVVAPGLITGDTAYGETHQNYVAGRMLQRGKHVVDFLNSPEWYPHSDYYRQAVDGVFVWLPAIGEIVGYTKWLPGAWNVVDQIHALIRQAKENPQAMVNDPGYIYHLVLEYRTSLEAVGRGPWQASFGIPDYVAEAPRPALAICRAAQLVVTPRGKEG